MPAMTPWGASSSADSNAAEYPPSEMPYTPIFVAPCAPTVDTTGGERRRDPMKRARIGQPPTFVVELARGGHLDAQALVVGPPRHALRAHHHREHGLVERDLRGEARRRPRHRKVELPATRP